MDFDSLLPFSIATRVLIVKVVCTLFFLCGVCLLGYGVWLLIAADQVYGSGEQEQVLECPIPENTSLDTPKKAIVAIAGGVVSPGMYEVPSSARVGDLIAKAGGLSDKADGTYVDIAVNLARSLHDGEGVYIPLLEDKKVLEACSILATHGAREDTGQVVPSESEQSGGIVSINSASQASLETLPGIGEKRAEAIIDGRPYASLSELVSSEIISESIFESIVDLIQL